jgi:hypothetical protein
MHWPGAYSAIVEPRATTDIDLLMLIEHPTREGIQSLLSSQFDSTWSILLPWCSKESRFGARWVFVAVKMWSSISCWRTRNI